MLLAITGESGHHVLPKKFDDQQIRAEKSLGYYANLDEPFPYFRRSISGLAGFLCPVPFLDRKRHYWSDQCYKDDPGVS